MMIAPFPEFTLNFSLIDIVFLIIEFVILSIILATICWIYRNSFFGQNYFRRCMCPLCHGKMTKLYLSINDNVNDNDDYIIYKCDCGFRSSALLYFIYDKAVSIFLKQECIQLNEGGEKDEDKQIC